MRIQGHSPELSLDPQDLGDNDTPASSSDCTGDHVGEWPPEVVVIM
jgi:hypothetical protein